MNTSRELFLLFPHDGQEIEGHTAIHKRRYINDEPSYIMITYSGTTTKHIFTAPIYEEKFNDFYLIIDEDSKKTHKANE